MSGTGVDAELPEGVAFDERPPPLGLWIAFGFALLAAAFAGSGSGLSLFLAGLGLALLVGGLFIEIEPLLTSGAVLLFLAQLVRVGGGGDLELSILGAAFAIVAWDVGEHTHSLAGYVGRSGRSRHAILTHTGLGLLVGLVPVGVGYLVYSLAPGGRPLSALVLLLLAALFVIVSLRR